MISGKSSAKHDYCYIRDRQLQIKLLAADDSFEQACLAVVPPCVSSQQRLNNLQENKISEVTGWCPNERLILRRPENDMLSKPKTAGASKDQFHDRGSGWTWRDFRLRRETPEINFVFHHYLDTHKYIEQYRNEHRYCGSATPSAAKADSMEQQRSSLPSARNVNIANSSVPLDVSHTKKEPVHVATPQLIVPSEPTSRAQKFKLTPSAMSDSDVQTSKWSTDHAVIPTSIPRSQSNSNCNVDQPANRMPASKFGTKTFRPATMTVVPKLTERASSCSGTHASWDAGSGWRTLDTLGVIANSGSKQSELKESSMKPDLPSTFALVGMSKLGLSPTEKKEPCKQGLAGSRNKVRLHHKIPHAHNTRPCAKVTTASTQPEEPESPNSAQQVFSSCGSQLPAASYFKFWNSSLPPQIDINRDKNCVQHESAQQVEAGPQQMLEHHLANKGRQIPQSAPPAIQMVPVTYEASSVACADAPDPLLASVYHSLPPNKPGHPDYPTDKDGFTQEDAVISTTVQPLQHIDAGNATYLLHPALVPFSDATALDNIICRKDNSALEPASASSSRCGSLKSSEVLHASSSPRGDTAPHHKLVFLCDNADLSALERRIPCPQLHPRCISASHPSQPVRRGFGAAPQKSSSLSFVQKASERSSVGRAISAPIQRTRSCESSRSRLTAQLSGAALPRRQSSKTVQMFSKVGVRSQSMVVTNHSRSPIATRRKPSIPCCRAGGMYGSSTPTNGISATPPELTLTLANTCLSVTRCLLNAPDRAV